MNCKPGDLAVMVSSEAGNEGCIVRCQRLATRQELHVARFRTNLGPVWIVDQDLRCSDGTKANMAPDVRLRPIRDPGEDAQDETLAWKPVPAGKREPETA